MSSGSALSFCRLWYICSVSDPGRSTRPQPSMKSVSPETRVFLIRKHCDPGVCPGVCRNSISIGPTSSVSPESTLTMSDSEMLVTLRTPSASSRCA